MKQERQSYQATLLRLWERYKFFVVAILLGAVLTAGNLRPESESQKQETEKQDEVFDLQAFQQQVADSLSQIDGAGSVTVLLSADVSESSQAAENNSSESYERSTSILSDGSYGEAPILIKSKYPTFRGAMILCEGADDDAVRLQIVHAVSALCGISSDHISVSKRTQ